MTEVTAYVTPGTITSAQEIDIIQGVCAEMAEFFAPMNLVSVGMIEDLFLVWGRMPVVLDMTPVFIRNEILPENDSLILPAFCNRRLLRAFTLQFVYLFFQSSKLNFFAQADVKGLFFLHFTNR